jgi:ATP-dependent RNA helicase DDX5/DBP2
VNIIVCTDVAARGIHIKRLKHVVNYDFPSNIEQYCHRIGRVGRQGEYGEAYSLMTRNFAPLANDLIALLKRCGKEPEPNLEKLAVDYSLGKILDDLDETLGNNEDDQNNEEEDQEEDEEENS